jgi:hypothetical protein
VVHVSRLGALFTVVLGSLAWGCGGPDGASDAPPGETSEGKDLANVPAFSPDGNFAVSLPTQTIDMTGLAELKVNEGDPNVVVTVTISRRTRADDVLLMDLSFDGLQNALGEHHGQFGLPSEDESGHTVNGILDGTWYYSQGGDIAVSLSADGQLDATFDIQLVRGDMPDDPSEPVVFAPSEESTELVGSFSIPWKLSCHSKLPGHSVSYTFGGEYCEHLEF